MDNIGEQLSRARQQQGLSVIEVASRLRIRTKFVEALERDDWNAIGEFVYVRGFLKNYAQLLGLDAQPLMVHLSNNYQSETPRPVAAPSPQQFDRSLHQQLRSPTERRWFPWVLGTLTAVATILVIVVAVSILSPLLPANRAAQPASAPASQSPAEGLQPAQNSAASLDGSSNTDTSQLSGVNLRLQLTQRSWLSITVDGRRVVYETLPAGTVRDFHGEHEITLRAGNAGGVEAKIDGKNLGKLGQAGQVEDRVFAVKTSPANFSGAHE